MVIQASQRGYVALIAVLIVGAVATAIGVALLAIGTDAQRTALTRLQSQQARGLAIACGQEALQQIHDNVAFSSTGTNMNLGQGSCIYKVTVNTPTSRNISAIGTVGSVVREVAATVTVGSTTLTGVSWRDVADTTSIITHIQSNGSTSDTGTTSIAQAFSSATTAGNLIAVAISWDSTTSKTVTCTDTQGNPYTTVNIWNDDSNKQALAICYAARIAGGANTVTATFGASSTFRRIVVSEYNGVAGVNPVDVSTGVGGAVATTGINAVTSGTATTTQGGVLIFGAVMNTTTSSTITAGTGFTQRFALNNKDFIVEDMQQASAGLVAATFTFGATNRYDAAFVAFEPASQ